MTVAGRAMKVLDAKRRAALRSLGFIAVLQMTLVPAAADTLLGLDSSSGASRNADLGQSAKIKPDLFQAVRRVAVHGLEVTPNMKPPMSWTSPMSWAPPMSCLRGNRLAAAEQAPPTPTTSPNTEASAEAPPAEPATECDAIAGLRERISSAAAVHEVNETDWLRGAKVCAAEVQKHPGEMRFVYQLGRAQDHLKNYIEALRDYKIAVNANYTDAMVDLGALYYLGHGVVQNYFIAFDYFSKAAAAGSNRAMGNLAGMYADGVGVAKDDAKSLDLAEKSIEAGNPFGLKIVADHYFNGAGVPRDYPMAAQYLQQAADIGDGQSMKFLANMYESGYLGPPNPAKAGALRLRAQQVDPESRDPIPARLPILRKTSSQNGQTTPVGQRRRYVVYRPAYHYGYRPSWQAAPGDTSCCPNSMLVCPLGRHFCGH